MAWCVPLDGTKTVECLPDSFPATAAQWDKYISEVEQSKRNDGHYFAVTTLHDIQSTST